MLQGFQVKEKLYESEQSLIYRALRTEDEHPVVLKMLNSQYPTPRQLARYQQEFTIIRGLDDPGVIQAHGLERYGHTAVIVVEDFGGTSLHRSFEERRPTILELLDIAIQISAALGHIHRRGVIHKDINPSNIVWNPGSRTIKVIDFGLATQLASEAPSLESLRALEGTLPYISPEQTGRMNRPLDYRTDFYALGATFYHLLTGHCPFESQDPLELVHCHLAAQPPHPAEHRDDIPPALCDIVLKLLAKTAEQRYQSAWGLEADLQRCRDQLQAGRTTVRFPLGSQDVSDRFEIPHKLYGRDSEIRALRDAFERVSRQPREIVMITGYSGIGKSSLVGELYEPIAHSNGFFVSGKFDLRQRATPYSAISAAFAALFNQLLGGAEDELEQWRERLLAALGPNGRLLTNLIPELELLVGEQPEVEATGPIEAQSRLLLAFRNLIGVLSQPEHPLLMFLDDLQWADPASLRLLETMMLDGTLAHFLLIGAYRDNEVDATHPLAILLEGLDRDLASIIDIRLRPLSLDHVVQLVGDALRRPPADARPLAEHVLGRTGGNPFFINVFLRSLHEDGLLAFDAKLPGWRWDMGEIQARATQATDNVAELLSAKLRKLPDDIRPCLQMAACAGNRFDLHTLAIIADRPPQDTSAALMAAVHEGYIHPLSKPELIEEDGQSLLCIREYRFVHDRIQQAAYALNPEHRLPAIHLEIGRLLLSRLAPEEREDRLFELVDHLNVGSSLLDAEQADLTPVTLARLNLEAGTRALAAAAYGAATRYLEVGIELAGDAWDQHYDLMLSLHQEAAQAAYCASDFERSQALIDAALAHVTTPVGKARLHQLAIVQYTNQARYDDVLRAARAALEALGHALPGDDELAAALEQELARIRELLGDRSIDTLIDAPEMTDEAHRATAEILVALIAWAFASNVSMFHYLSARIVGLCLEHGQAAAGAFGYSCYGMVLVSKFQDYQRAYEFGALTLRLADRFHSPSLKCKAGAAMINQLYHWARPLKDFDAVATETYQAGLEAGEMQYAAFILASRVLSHMSLGLPLPRILEDARGYLQFCESNHNSSAINVIEGVRIPAAYLAQVEDDDAHALVGARFLDKARKEGLTAVGFFHTFMCQAHYMCQAYEAALQAAEEADACFAYFSGAPAAPVLSLCHALSAIALLPGSSAEEAQAHRQTIARHQQRLKPWAASCPENFRHMELLIEAELARVAGEDLAAVRRYTEAIEAAEQNGFIHHAALGNELAARFWLDRGQLRYATAHMRDARYGYATWGAERKLAMLEEQHARLFVQPWQEHPRPAIPGTVATTSTTSGAGTVSTTSDPMSTLGTAGTLDLASVLRASQALSSEIALDRLLARMTGIVIQTAGAQHGYLVLQRKDELVIEAQGTIEGGEVKVLHALAIETTGGTRPPVSTNIINYVRRTREPVVLRDAAREGAFVRDPHVMATKARSILCMPLLHQGRVTGVVYLENNLSSGAFTPERVELLRLLSSQMAISLENSQLYSNLHRTNQDLERILYSISHDLKEPLRSVQSFSELILRRYSAQLDDKGRDYLARVIQSGQRLAGLFEALRTIMKIRRSTEPRQRVPGAALVQHVVERLRPFVDEVRATVRVAPELPHLTVERQWAQEALFQIVHNALQYACDDVGPEIDIGPYKGSEGVGFVIQDRGPGIAVEHAERVFDLFRRIVGREHAGHGAGLTIARQIALKHAGNAWLRPRPGGGTEVYLTFGR